jgi:hypothetical protein
LIRRFGVNGLLVNFDPNQICLNNVKCVKNADGSYDFEIIVEFWPQRLFYIGLIISGTTLLACFGYLGWEMGRRKNLRLNGRK